MQHLEDPPKSPHLRLRLKKGDFEQTDLTQSQIRHGTDTTRRN